MLTIKKFEDTKLGKSNLHSHPRNPRDIFHFRQLVIIPPRFFQPVADYRHRDEHLSVAGAVDEACAVAGVHDAENVQVLLVAFHRLL
jgi:hypothetical protein